MKAKCRSIYKMFHNEDEFMEYISRFHDDAIVEFPADADVTFPALLEFKVLITFHPRREAVAISRELARYGREHLNDEPEATTDEREETS